MPNYQVSCINRANHTDPHLRIQYIGGVNNGQRWKITIADAIYGMRNSQWAFYVYEGNHIAWLIIAEHNKREYLKTQNDGLHPDNLLSLQECP
jgi:hypothetical protein